MSLVLLDERPFYYGLPAKVYKTYPLPAGCALANCTELDCPATGRKFWNHNAYGWPSNSADGSAHMLPCFTQALGSLAPLTGGSYTIAVTRATATSPLVTTLVPLPANDYTGYSGKDNGIKQVASASGVSFWVSGMATHNYGYRYYNPLSSTSSVLVCGMGQLSSKGVNFIEPGTKSARGLTLSRDGGYNYHLYGASDWAQEHTYGGLYGIGSASGAPQTLTKTVSRLWGIANTLPGGPVVKYNPYTFVFESPSSLWLSMDQSGEASLCTPTCAYATIVHYVQGNGQHQTIEAAKWLRQSTVVVRSENSPLYSLTGRYEAWVPGETPGFAVYAASPTHVYRLAPGASAPVVLMSAACGQSFHGVAFPPIQPGQLPCDVVPSVSPYPTCTSCEGQV